MKMPSNRQEIAFGRYQGGEAPLAHRDLQEQLYDLYKKISKEIPVETTHYSASQAMPLVRYGRRFVKEDERKFKFRGVGFKSDGEMCLKTTKHHVALKGYFGIDNFFKRQGVAPYIESSVLGFSGKSAVRGKSELVAKSLLTKPSGTTTFDSEGFEKEIEDSALVLSISDGEFSMNGSQKTSFEQKIRTADYAHIQIGGDTAFSTYLKDLGVPVINVKGDEDLSRSMVSFVSSYYKQSPKIAGATA